MQKMNEINIEVRKAVSQSGLTLWQVAEQLGITDSTFSRWLRHELDDSTKTKIFTIISSMGDENMWVNNG